MAVIQLTEITSSWPVLLKDNCNLEKGEEMMDIPRGNQHGRHSWKFEAHFQRCNIFTKSD